MQFPKKDSSADISKLRKSVEILIDMKQLNMNLDESNKSAWINFLF